MKTNLSIWSFVILGLQQFEVAANSTQYQDLNLTKTVNNRRQEQQQQQQQGGAPETPPGYDGKQIPGAPPRGDVGHVNEAVLAAAKRYSTPAMTTKKFWRTTPRRVSFTENCDYLAHYCLKAYDTGKLCGRTLYYRYYTFKNYCLLDYVNCMERYEVWQVVHMGNCFYVKELTEYILYPYDDDFFLDQYYIVEDN